MARRQAPLFQIVALPFQYWNTFQEAIDVSPGTLFSSVEDREMEKQRELDLAGKVVIITGASRGVGKQAALDFRRRGANVVLAARTVKADDNLPGTIGETLEQIEASGGKAIAVATDLAKEEDLERLVDAAVNRFGGVDILINNAAATTGDIWGKPFLELTREEWLYQFCSQHSRPLHADSARRADHGEARRWAHHQRYDRQW